MRPNVAVKIICSLACLALVVWAVAEGLQQLSEVRENPPVEDFALLDLEGRAHRLSYYSDANAIVLMSYGIGCPIARQAVSTLRQLRDRFREDGVPFFLIDANPADDREALLKEARAFGIDIPILMDPAQLVTPLLGITRTAEAIVIDPEEQVIAYHGAIDDRVGYEIQRATSTKQYLAWAIESLLKGEEVTIKETDVKGCLIDLRYELAPNTYTKTIVPILQKKCLSCHHSNGAAPWAMTDYKTMKSWSPMIREVLRTRRMPPRQIDTYDTKVEHDASLRPEELRHLVRWIEHGSPRGEGSDPLPALEKKASEQEEWPLGPPDIIVAARDEQQIPATGVLKRRTLISQEVVEKDIWARAVYYKPSNYKVVHHASAWIIARSERHRAITEGSVLLDGYSPGYLQRPYPEGTVKFIPKGSRIYFVTHYYTTGKPETERPQVGIYVHQETERPVKLLHILKVSSRNFKIPAGAKAHEVIAEERLEEDIVVYGVAPHMHYRGRSMKITARLPDGREEFLLSVPNFDYSWNLGPEWLKEPRFLPAGTLITVKGIFDNSIQNPKNLDPTKDVVFGWELVDEMFNAKLTYAVADKAALAREEHL